jgi:hypothetical protein
LPSCLIDLKKEKKKEKRKKGRWYRWAISIREEEGHKGPLALAMKIYWRILFLTPAVAMNASATDFL